MRLFVYLTTLFAAFAFSACTHYSAVESAAAQIREGKIKCAVIRDGAIIATAVGNGVSPLLDLYHADSKQFQNAVIVDKVIGRAAAFIILAGSAKEAYGLLMSEDALELLQKHGVECRYDTLVPRILNRKRDSLCPLERSVQGKTDAKDAIKSLEEKIQSMRR